jgi:hypothetical protein
MVEYLLLLGLAKESRLLILGGDYHNVSSCFKIKLNEEHETMLRDAQSLINKINTDD